MKFTIPSLLALAPLMANAILITSPTNSTTLTKGETATISWTSVDTDPTTFGVVLVNFVYWPPTYIQLAENVATSANSTTVTIPCDTFPTDGYQFNAINGTNLFVIYAQSGKFDIDGEDCTDPTGPAEPTCEPSTVTVTAMPSATPPPAWGGKGGKGHHKTQGKVPKTIGWHGKDKGGYGSPVTLGSVPTNPPVRRP